MGFVGTANISEIANNGYVGDVGNVFSNSGEEVRHTLPTHSPHTHHSLTTHSPHIYIHRSTIVDATTCYIHHAHTQHTYTHHTIIQEEAKAQEREAEVDDMRAQAAHDCARMREQAEASVRTLVKQAQVRKHCNRDTQPHTAAHCGTLQHNAGHFARCASQHAACDFVGDTRLRKQCNCSTLQHAAHTAAQDTHTATAQHTPCNSTAHSLHTGSVFTYVLLF